MPASQMVRSARSCLSWECSSTCRVAYVGSGAQAGHACQTHVSSIHPDPPEAAQRSRRCRVTFWELPCQHHFSQIVHPQGIRGWVITFPVLLRLLLHAPVCVCLVHADKPVRLCMQQKSVCISSRLIYMRQHLFATHTRLPDCMEAVAVSGMPCVSTSMCISICETINCCDLCRLIHASAHMHVQPMYVHGSIVGMCYCLCT